MNDEEKAASILELAQRIQELPLDEFIRRLDSVCANPKQFVLVESLCRPEVPSDE
jgi:hypothetical protein